MTNDQSAGSTATELPDVGDNGAQPPSHPTPDDYVLGDRNPTDDIFVAERPWGTFQQFVSNEQVTVKIITVAPGHRLSLQRHNHRGEMWQVLDVPIDITVDDRTWTATAGETVNSGTVLCELKD